MCYSTYRHSESGCINDRIQNPFLTAQSTQIKWLYQCQSKILFITILGHCLTTYRVGTHFYDIPGSGSSLTTYDIISMMIEIGGELKVALDKWTENRRGWVTDEVCRSVRRSRHANKEYRKMRKVCSVRTD